MGRLVFSRRTRDPRNDLRSLTLRAGAVSLAAWTSIHCWLFLLGNADRFWLARLVVSSVIWEFVFDEHNEFNVLRGNLQRTYHAAADCGPGNDELGVFPHGPLCDRTDASLSRCRRRRDRIGAQII